MNTRFVVELESGDVLPLERATGVRLACLEGSLWITEEGEGADIVLAGGESYAIEAKGRALVQALGHSRLAVEATGKRPQVAFGTLSQARLAA
jgi:quercetin dioxygenase-like cupin family protein